jgi:hypothetical protein
MVHENLCDEENKSKLIALMSGKLFEISHDKFFGVDLSQYSMCLQKGHRESCQRLVLDKQGKEQIHIDLIFRDGKPIVLSSK